MSAMNRVEELQNELLCPICLEPFKDPVILECGHNYCQACITHSSASSAGICPQCRQSFPESELRPNQQLEAVAHLAEALEEECKKHSEVFTHYCREERTLLCRVCKESREHRDHTVLPIEKAAEEFKEELLSHWNHFQHVREEHRKRVDAEEGNYAALQNQTQDLLFGLKQMRQILKQGEHAMRDRLDDFSKRRKKSTEGLLRLDKHIAVINQTREQQGIKLLKEIDSTLRRCEQVKGEEEAPAESLTELESRVQALPESQKTLCELLQRFKELAPELGLPENTLSDLQRQTSDEDSTEDVTDDPKQENSSVCLLDCEDGKLNSDCGEKQAVDHADKQNNSTGFTNVEQKEPTVSVSTVLDSSFTNNSVTLNLLENKPLIPGLPGQRSDSKCRRCRRWKIPAAVAVLLTVILIPVLAWSMSKACVTPLESPAACCPEKWIGYHGKCYFISEEESNWTSSKQLCSSHNASLVLIDTLLEKDFLMQQKGYLDAWIGLRREPGQPWKWPNGSVFNPLFHIEGGGECAYRYKNTISTSTCYLMRHYICSKPDDIAKKKIT